MGLLLDDGMDRCDEGIDDGDAMMHLLTEGSQCPQCLKEFKSAKGQNCMTAYGIDRIYIIVVIVRLI